MNYFDLIDEAYVYDMGAIDIFLLETETEYGTRYWVTTGPSFQDATTYETRDYLGESIYDAIRQHEGWDDDD